MTETEARRVALLQGFETPLAEPWTDADATWASQEARRATGEAATAEAFVSARARLGLDRLMQRAPSLRTPLQRGMSQQLLPGAAVTAALALALAAGMSVESIGSDGRIHLLAPPLAALLIWNLGVMIFLSVAWAYRHSRALLRRRQRVPSAAPILPVGHLPGWLGALLLRRFGSPSGGTPVTAPAVPTSLEAGSGLTRGFALLAQRLSPIMSRQVTALLHAAAAALVIGALMAMYARGMGFAFRAGWDSTFLNAAQVHAWVTGLLGPAARVMGWTPPSPEAFAALRFSVGPGEPAAPWIHAWALTALVMVVLPRSLLAWINLRQARALSAHMPFSVDEPYVARLAAQRGNRALQFVVLPYAHRPGPEVAPWLQAALERLLGPSCKLHWQAAVLEGEEDRLPALLQGRVVSEGDQHLAVLVHLSSTPERETHGRYLEQVRDFASAATSASRTLLLVNEAGFGARMSAGDAEQRKRHRRLAWQRLAEELGCPLLFMDPGHAMPAGEARDRFDDALAAALQVI